MSKLNGELLNVMVAADDEYSSILQMVTFDN
jgi:hypothetical protein